MLEQTQQAVSSGYQRGSNLFVPAALLAAVLLSGSAMHAAVGTQTRLQSALATPIKELDLRGRSTLEGLLGLAYKYRLPLGIEYIDARFVCGRTGLYLRNTTVRAASESLVKQLPEYRVDFSGGLVDVYSARARRDPSNVLSITVRRFQVTQMDAMEASSRLQDEVFAKLHPGVGYGGEVVHGQTSPSEPRVTLRLNNRKVYEIMNAIVASDGAAIWLVVVPPENLARFDWNQWAVYNLNPAGKDPIVSYLKKLFPPQTQVHP